MRWGLRPVSCCGCCAADVLADIMKADPEDTDARMSDAGDENSFARANEGDSPDWTARPMHIIQATPPAEDSATHDITHSGPEEGAYLAQPDEAVSSPPALFPAATADGTVYYLQDTCQPGMSAEGVGPARSDVSMAAPSHDDVPPGLAELPSRSGEVHGAGTTSNYHMDSPSEALDHLPDFPGSGLSGGEALAASALARADAKGSGSGGSDQADGWSLPEKTLEDDGDRSDIEEFQDISDDDMPKKDLFGAGIGTGYYNI